MNKSDTKNKWNVLKNVAGITNNKRSNISFTPNELNQFYARFEKNADIQTSETNQSERSNDIPPPEVSEAEIRKAMQRLKPSSASGPDNVPATLLKHARSALDPILQKVFT